MVFSRGKPRKPDEKGKLLMSVWVLCHEKEVVQYKYQCLFWDWEMLIMSLLLALCFRVKMKREKTY
jgi:hypothetical protein